MSTEPQADDLDLLRVLVVDDNASILRFLAATFTASGCFVSQAGAAEEALTKVADQTFDLIVSDIKMPGLSGLDLLRAVKGRQPSTPVVLITGAPSVNSAIFGLRHGAYDYLPKPFAAQDVEQLVQRVKRDRAKHDGQLPYPAGVAEEMARREFGVEVLFKIGELALRGLEPADFLDMVLDYTVQSLHSDAALLLLRDEDGSFKANQKGHPALVNHLLTTLQSSFEQVVTTGGGETVSLTASGHPVDAIAAVIPGIGKSMAIVCLARDARNSAFLPDEKDLLLGYARTGAVALQKILLRENLEKNIIDTIAAFVTAIESKDLYLKGHSARVSLYAREIAATMSMPDEQTLVICRGALLHDLGKLVVVDALLQKPGRLTEEEYALVKSHAAVGDKILKPLRFLAREAQAVRNHHERYDGTGYPDGLKGEDIPLIARVVTVADAFDAMTSTRPYRAALPLERGQAEIARGRTSQFDPVVADAFATIPLARLVEISRFQSATSEPPVTAQ
ncbi:MAG: HD domain-containing phosphohydrolase [Candidatus Rokuibacteriota bacterium]